MHNFYIVELREWRDGTLFPHARNREGFDKQFLRTHGLRIEEKKADAVLMRHINGGELRIRQWVFENFDAAQLYFDKVQASDALKDGDFAIEVILLQVEARSLSNARVLPPERYANRSAVFLRQYRPHLSATEYRVTEAKA